MKAKKTVSVICCLLVLVLTAMSLTACLKIAMKEKGIRERLTKAGAEITEEKSAPMIDGWQTEYSIGSILRANKVYVDRVEDGNVERAENLYIIFAKDDGSAGWVEKRCNEFISDNSEDLKGWEVYRYDEIVMCGYYRLLSVARTY